MSMITFVSHFQKEGAVGNDQYQQIIFGNLSTEELLFHLKIIIKSD